MLVSKSMSKVFFFCLFLCLSFLGVSSVALAEGDASGTSVEEKVDIFRYWFEGNGGFISPSVGIEALKDYNGLGLVAKPTIPGAEKNRSQLTVSAIQQLDVLVSVPDKLFMHANETVEAFEKWIEASHEKEVQDTPESSSNETIIDKFGSILSALEQETQQNIILAIRLMIEQCFHSTSDFAPYLDILPQTLAPRFDTFSELEWDSLLLENIDTFSYMKQTVDDRKEVLRSAFSEIEALGLWDVLTKGRAALDRENDQNITMDGDFCSFDWLNFHHFLAIVESRVMSMDGGPVHVMMPMADLLNHSPSPPAGSLTKDGNMYYQGPFGLYHNFNEDNTVYNVRADRPVLPNQQIFEDYGPFLVGHFVETGGFVPDEYTDPEGPYITQQHYVTIPTSYLWDGEKDSSNYYLRNATRDDFVPKHVWVRADGSLASNRDAGRLAMIAMSRDDDGPDRPCFEALDHEEPDRELVRALCTRYQGAEERVHNMLQGAARRLLDSAQTSVEQDIEYFASLSSWIPEGVSIERANVAIQLRIIDKHVLNLLAKGFSAAGIGKDSIDQCSGSETGFCGTVPVEDGSPRRLTQNDIDSFNSFIESFSPNVSKVEVRFIGDSGMRAGVVAKEDIKQGEVYFSYPISGTVSRHHLSFPKNPALEAVVQTMDRENDCEHCLEIFLMYEYFVLREESRWWPYLNLIPSPEEVKVMYPFFLRKEQLEMLAGSDTRGYMLNRQKHARDIFEMLSTNVDLVEAMGPSIMLDMEKYIWAFNIHRTRGIPLNVESHLHPLVDNINCDERPNDDGELMWEHDVKLNDEGTASVSTAPRSFNEGDRVEENYAQSNYVYMTHHGFLLENNSYDCALVDSLSIPTLILSQNETEDCLKRLSEIDVDSLSPSFCIGGIHGDSLDKVAKFLIIKAEMEKAQDESSDVVDGYDLLRKFLDERIHRHEVLGKHRLGMRNEVPLESLSRTELNMLRFMRKEKLLFEEAREQLDMLLDKRSNQSSIE